MSISIPVLSLGGQEVAKYELNAVVFGADPSPELLHSAVVWQLARKRSGCASAKTRGEVSLSTKKTYKQKGTGSARHGNRSVQLFRGGGVTFAPKNRSYEHGFNKKMRSKSLCVALSDRYRSGGVLVIDDIALMDHKTSSCKIALRNIGVEGRSILIVDVEVNRNLLLSARNIPNVNVLPLCGLNVYSILRSSVLIISRPALEALEMRFSSE